jgi:hypothetical protein
MEVSVRTIKYLEPQDYGMWPQTWRKFMEVERRHKMMMKAEEEMFRVPRW